MEDCSKAWKYAGGWVEAGLVTGYLSFTGLIMHNNKF